MPMGQQRFIRSGAPNVASRETGNSQRIRKAAASLRLQNKVPSVKNVIAMLAKQGLEVPAAHVSQVLKREKLNASLPTAHGLGEVLCELLVSLTSKSFSCTTKKTKVSALPTNCRAILMGTAPDGPLTGKENAFLLRPNGLNTFAVVTCDEFDEEDEDYHWRYVYALLEQPDQTWQLIHETSGEV